MISKKLGRYSGQLKFMGLVIALGLMVLVLCTLGTLAYREVYTQATLYRSYKMLQQGAGQADSLSVEYTFIQKNLQNIRDALPNQNQGSVVLNILVEEARRMDLGIAGITALDEVPFPGYKELPFEMNLSGGLTSLVKYLHTLETRGMVLQLRKLSTHSEAINKSKITAKLELSVFIPQLGSVP